ncbi:MAG: FAD-linked oxidase C-terminal domain-containing protein [Chitinophagales bacterium]|nr:FAD-binding protein [Chitinophagales bacterium]MDW8393844.1 FAD-linked oxidase C-terminal domain-containing protein [Chitinophagales bacterium]
MMYQAIGSSDIQFFQSIVGSPFVLTDADLLNRYGRDETEDLLYCPDAVVLPSEAGQISRILAYCSERRIPVTPRGAGTGLSGGALPVFGGLVLSTERMNRILFIDERNFQVTTEPGVITEVLQETVKQKGLFYPPDPASRGSCFIGGNIAENSGGPRAVKYGVVKDYVLNLEVVLPSGNIIWTGASVLKNATGYNLTQLMVGSEGTLGIVTRIVLRLLPHPRHDMLMLVPFHSAAQACEAVNAIFLEGIIPSAAEFMERDAARLSLQLTPSSIALDEQAEAFLLLETDGNDPELLFRDMEKIHAVVQRYAVGETLLAETADQKAALWKLRRSIGEAVRRHSVYKEEDTVVPRAELPVLLDGVKAIGRRYGFRSVCYGHAGDGNLHVNILKEQLSDAQWNELLPRAIKEIFELCVRLGGTISGEHGIGWVQKPYLSIAFNPIQMDLMKKIKHVFDPAGILNPGKIFD